MKIKNIFKKNQVIIGVLALMIAVAGYLNFAKDKVDEKSKEDAASSAVSSDIFSGTQGEHYADISDEDSSAIPDIAGVDSTQGQLIVNDTASTEGDLVSKENVEAQDSAQTPADGEQVADATDPTESDTNVSSDNPGEAILASTTINSSYFSTAKLTREQQRAKNKEALMGIIADATVSEEQKNDAIDTVIEMTAIAEKENATEILLEAKGYSGAVVCIVDDSVDVIVNAEALTEQDMAIIEDVVMRKTGADAKNIKITNVIAED